MNTYHRNETVWESADGTQTLVKDLDTAHLVNILNWIKTNNTIYGDALFQFMEKEAGYRKTFAFCSNGPIPVKLDSGFYTLINQTLSGRIKSLILQKKAHIIMDFKDNPNWFKSLIVKALKVKKKVDKSD